MSIVRLFIALFLVFLLGADASPLDLKCLSCESIASVVIPLAKNNKTRDFIYPIAIRVCEVLELHSECQTASECKDLCIGIVNSYIDLVLELAYETVLNPAEICYLAGQCEKPAPPQPPTDFIRSNLTDYSGEHHWPSWDSPSGYFIHMSDLHVDVNYSPGSNADCGEPDCCNARYGPGVGDAAAGYWGDYRCDLPSWTISSLFDLIASRKTLPDFILYTGDDPAHDIWLQSQERNLQSTAAISSLMLASLLEIPIFHTLGNHESFPVNQFEGPGADAWLYEPVSSYWSHWLSNDAERTLAYGGFYAARVRPGLRVLSLNSNYYMSDNFWLVKNNTDFSGQLSWLVDALDQVRSLNEKVIIISHALPDNWRSDFADQFMAIIRRYQDIFIGYFAGHTHHSQVSLFTSTPSGTPFTVGFVAGSTTYQNINPGYRLSYYDPSSIGKLTYLVQDYDEYWIDISTESRNAEIVPNWDFVRMNALLQNHMPDLSPSSWSAYATRILETQDDSNTVMLQAYSFTKNHGFLLVESNVTAWKISVYCEVMNAAGSENEACHKKLGAVRAEVKSSC